MNTMNPVILSIIWAGWCTVHSLLITTAMQQRIRLHTPWLVRYYRLVYNGWSLISLAPLLFVTMTAGGPVVFAWTGYFVVLRFALLGTALLLFYGGMREYDLSAFLGLRQLRTGEDQLLLNENDHFSTAGVFGITRHPWYLGAILFIWSASARYLQPIFLAACIMSLYLVIGTFLEERKIAARYGDSYNQYRGRVSMLLPWKWFFRLLR